MANVDDGADGAERLLRADGDDALLEAEADERADWLLKADGADPALGAWPGTVGFGR